MFLALLPLSPVSSSESSASSSFVRSSRFHRIFRFPTLSLHLYFYAQLVQTSRWQRASWNRNSYGMIPCTNGNRELQLVLTYILYALSACYFRLNVYFPALKMYLHHHLAPCFPTNPLFCAAALYFSWSVWSAYCNCIIHMSSQNIVSTAILFLRTRRSV